MQPKNTLFNLCKIVTVMAIVLGLTNIVVSNQLSTQGRELALVNGDLVRLEKEAAFINEQIAAESSLAKIDQRATNLGFVAIEHPVALTASERVALVTAK